MNSFAPGDVLKCNKHAHLGMHYNYDFFKVKHVTKKGTVMGHFLEHSNDLLEFRHDYRTNRWRVHDATVGKVRKLPRPWSWEHVTEKEREEGVVACSCVY